MLIGFAMFAAVIVNIALMGGYHVHGLGSVSGAVGMVGFMAAAAVTEELMFRGLLFRLVEERLGTWLSLLLTGVLFGLMHLLNPDASLWGATAIAIEAGFMLAACYAATRNLWVPIGLHFGWNFAAGGIFGVGRLRQRRVGGAAGRQHVGFDTAQRRRLRAGGQPLHGGRRGGADCGLPLAGPPPRPHRATASPRGRGPGGERYGLLMITRRMLPDSWRRWPVTVRDLPLALVIALASVTPPLRGIGTQLGDLPARPFDALTVVVIALECLPLALRRSRPALSLALVSLGFAIDQVRALPHLRGRRARRRAGERGRPPGTRPPCHGARRLPRVRRHWPSPSTGRGRPRG